MVVIVGCVVVCDLETSRMGAPYIYDISHLRVKYRHKPLGTHFSLRWRQQELLKCQYCSQLPQGTTIKKKNQQHNIHARAVYNACTVTYSINPYPANV